LGFAGHCRLGLGHCRGGPFLLSGAAHLGANPSLDKCVSVQGSATTRTAGGSVKNCAAGNLLHQRRKPAKQRGISMFERLKRRPVRPVERTYDIPQATADLDAILAKAAEAFVPSDQLVDLLESRIAALRGRQAVAISLASAVCDPWTGRPIR
jgi:hypothetical protein